MLNRIIAAALLGSASLLPASSAAAADAPATVAPTTVKANVDQIADILRKKKFAVETRTDDEGLPYIVTDNDERPFRIFLYDCDGGVRLGDCLSLQFYAAFTIGKPFPIDRINEWNRGRRFGRSYLDKDNDPSIEMDVNMAAGGMPPELFEDTVDLWIEIFTAFDDFVFETPKEGSAEPTTARAEAE